MLQYTVEYQEILAVKNTNFVKASLVDEAILKGCS